MAVAELTALLLCPPRATGVTAVGGPQWWREVVSKSKPCLHHWLHMKQKGNKFQRRRAGECHLLLGRVDRCSPAARNIPPGGT